MPIVSAIGLKPADHHYTQEDVLALTLALPHSPELNPDIIRQVFTNTRVKHRYFFKPLDEIKRLGSFADRNALFGDIGLKLCIEACEKCLQQAELGPEVVDQLIFVSTTGFSVPSLEARIIQKMGLRPDVKRMPVFGWGCNGGVAGLRVCTELAQSRPWERILLINLELCTLGYQPEDHTPKALIANALFNDAASAVLISGDECDLRRPKARLIGGRSRLYFDTLNIMGWDQKETGLQVVLSPRIPELVARESASFVRELLQGFELKDSDISSFVSHTGGTRILEALQGALKADPAKFASSWKTLENFGNMSSCSVHFVLKDALMHNHTAPGHGLLLSFGPGFSAEGLLIQWLMP